MLTAKKLMIPSSEEVRSEAVQTLIKRMGITKAAIFIRETQSQKIDYLKVKDQLLTGKSAAQVYMEIKKRKK
ncbi:MAG: hypothetical protein WCO53_15350 [Deltaproteobacteria bacterium]